jgi:hypothetical protein
MRDEATTAAPGGPITLRLTWAALDTLISEWGEAEYEARLQRAVTVPVLTDMARFIELAGGPPAQAIYDDSPPISAMITLVNETWARGWLGGETPPERDTQRSGGGNSGPLAWWRNICARFFARADRGATSGA